MIGRIIQNYEILRLIGEGGMGNVYAAKHVHLDKIAAIKILKIETSKHKDALARFEKEAKTLNKLRHKHIVELFDYGVSNEIPYIIMEYIDGIPLDEYIKTKSGPIPEEKASKYTLQILTALEIAHINGIIHRDIKPSNFILTKNDDIKILDFGIAKMVSETETHQLTKIGQGIGTLPYMSPEQIYMKNITNAIDIYALGVCLHQMITAKEPYDLGLSRREIEDKILKEPLPRIKEFYPFASDKIQAIIDKATEKEIQNRYKNCHEFAEALKNNKVIETELIEDFSKTLKFEEKPKEIIENKIDTVISIEKETPKINEKKSNSFLYLGIFVAMILIIFGIFIFAKEEYRVKIEKNNTVFFEKKYPDSTEAIKVGKLELEKCENESELTVKSKDELIFRLVKTEKIEGNEAETIEQPEQKPENNINTVATTTTEKKSSVQIFTPTSFQDNFRILANKNYDYASRQAHLEKFLKEFTSDAAVLVYQNGEKVETKGIKEYLQAIMFNGKQVKVSVTQKSGSLVRDIEVVEN